VFIFGLSPVLDGIRSQIAQSLEQIADHAIDRPMTPSLALAAHRDEIRRIVTANRGLNPRVFGSTLRHEDTETSDLDLLIDPAEGLSLFDMAEIALAVEALTETRVDVKTPDDLSTEMRQRVLAEAVPL
jgi:predicted nucleotidyltransferase